MRYSIVGMALLLALVAVVAAGDVGAARDGSAEPVSASTTAAPRVSATGSGPGFAICGASDEWRRPSESAERAHLGVGTLFDRLWIDDGAPAPEEFRAPAVLYDGRAASALMSIVERSGLWSAWPAPTCWTQQPQVFLFGYEPIRYDAASTGEAELRVRPAPGYRMVALTGPIRPRIRVLGHRALADLRVPPALVTPLG